MKSITSLVLLSILLLHLYCIHVQSQTHYSSQSVYEQQQNQHQYEQMKKKAAASQQQQPSMQHPNFRDDTEDLGEIWQKEWELVCEWEGVHEDMENPHAHRQSTNEIIRNSKGEKYDGEVTSRALAEDLCPFVGSIIRDELNTLVKERILSRRQRQKLNIGVPLDKEWEDEWKSQISPEVLEQLDVGELDHIHIPQGVVDLSLTEPFHHAGLYQLSKVFPLRRLHSKTKAEITDIIRTETQFYSWVGDMLSRRPDKMIGYLGDGNQDRASEWLRIHGSHVHQNSDRLERRRVNRPRHWSEIKFHDEL